MTYLALRRFGGMTPRYGKQTLPDTAAEIAENALLLSGELRGLNGLQKVVDLRDRGYEIKRIYRALYAEGGSEWVTFPDETIDMVKGPLVNDAFDRYYYTSEIDKPRMNTLIRLKDDLPGYLLGVPRPLTPPTVTADGSGIGDQDVTRAYVYTFVSAFGEEGAPSEPGIDTGKEDDVWQITNMETTVPDAAERNISHKNLYRTVSTPGGGVAYHFVAQIPLGTASYNDSISTDTVGRNYVMDAAKNEEPPDEMEGLIAHPNGFLVAFHGRDLFFSKPFQPHAWPSDFRLSTQDPIRGLGIFGTSIAVATSGYPYIAAGITPGNLTFTKAHTAEPCVSTRRGVVDMPFGVYYPSANGLFLIGPNGFAVATANLITKSEWQRDYSPWVLEAVRWQSQYVGFYDSDDGLMFSPQEKEAALVNLGQGVWEHSVLQTDLFSGAAWMVKDNVVYEWNPAFGIVQPFTWRSKEFVTPKPINFGAMAVEANVTYIPLGEGGFPPPGGGVPPEVGEEYQEFNDIRYNYPLNPLNFAALNMVRKIDTLHDFDGTYPVLTEHSQPHHESPLYRTGDIFAEPDPPPVLIAGLGDDISATDEESQEVADPILGGSLYVKVYGDNILRWEGQIIDQEMYRLPSGYKSRRWQFEFIGTVQLKSFKIAETGKELSQI